MKRNILIIAGLALAFTALPLAAQSTGGSKGPRKENPPANCDGKFFPNPGQGRGPNPNPGGPRGPRDGYGPGSPNCQGGGYCPGGGQGLQQRQRARQGQGNGQGQGWRHRAGQQ